MPFCTPTFIMKGMKWKDMFILVFRKVMHGFQGLFFFVPQRSFNYIFYELFEIFLYNFICKSFKVSLLRDISHAVMSQTLGQENQRWFLRVEGIMKENVLRFRNLAPWIQKLTFCHSCFIFSVCVFILSNFVNFTLF